MPKILERSRFRNVEKHCLYCGKRLKLNNNRDIKRKKFCSRSCVTRYTKPQKYKGKIIPAGLDPLAIYMECGRAIAGPYGYLVSRVLHIKRIYKTFVGLDANMANLMRPGQYGAYHHITVIGKEKEKCDQGLRRSFS